MHRRSASDSATEGNTQHDQVMQKRGRSTDQSVMAGAHSSSRFRAEAEAKAKAQYVKHAAPSAGAPVKGLSDDDQIVCQSKLYDAYELQEIEQHLDRIKLDFHIDRNIRSFSMPRLYYPGVPAHVAVQEQKTLQGLADHGYPASSSTSKVVIKAHKQSKAKRSRWSLVNSFFQSVNKKQNNMLITKEDATLPSSLLNDSIQPWNKELHHHHHIVHHHHHHHIMTGVHFEEIDWPLSPARLEELGWLMSKSCP